jgi:uncharacterized membrane protein YccC
VAACAHEIFAPTDGIINNLTVRIGDTAVADIPLVGIVDAHAWRIIANYKQDRLRALTIGGTAWVWLDSQPWHLHRARIAGIGRGISRDPEAEKLLPYVAPTTDWIRLQRRFPVTLMLVDPPSDLKLYGRGRPHDYLPMIWGTATGRILRDLLSALGREIAELHRPGKRARLCLMASLSVALSVAAALALRLDDPWWAAISGFISVQVSRPGSIKRGVLRITGTAVGAALGFFVAPWLAYDHVACAMVLVIVVALAVLGVMLSPHGYAWLFAGITAVMVLLMSLDDPTAALNVAFYRTAEVALGTISALFVALLLGSDDAGAVEREPPGWTDLLGANWPAVLHALRSGIAVALLPFLWSWLQLPDLSQMAITVTAVVAIPSLSDDPLSHGDKIATRGLQRMLGCLFGGLTGLAVLALSITEFLPWLLVLTAGVWVGTHVQASERGVGYAGIQGTVVFIMTLIQGDGPPTSILPGIDRFAAIMCGLAILAVISLVLAPVDRQPSSLARPLSVSD